MPRRKKQQPKKETQQKKLLLINSNGKGAGKTVVSETLESQFDFVPAQCKEQLHNETMEFLGMQPKDYWYTYQGFKDTKFLYTKNINFQEKEKLAPFLKGGKMPQRVGYDYYLTLRMAMIYVSEVRMKPRHGKDWYGRKRMDLLESRTGLWFVDDSAAFVDEVEPALDRLGSDNVYLLQLIRDGVNYDGDSRSLLPKELFKQENVFRIDNPTPPGEETDESLQELIGKAVALGEELTDTKLTTKPEKEDKEND